MIVRPRPGPVELWFILRGSIVTTILPRVLLIVAVAAVLVIVHQLAPRHFPDFTPAPFTLLGLALSIFLGFRNNACYERWWEARRQWGQLIAEARGFARDSAALLPDPLHARRIVAFAHALRDQLRKDERDETGAWLPPGEWDRVKAKRSRPDAILAAETADIAALLRRGDLSDQLYQLFSSRLQSMTTIQTACERLANTPTPFTYTLLLHRTAWLFCLLLPFGLIGTLGLVAPIPVAILAYAFFGLDALGEELEDPFGTTQNAVPLDAMVRGIEIAALEALGDPSPPPALQPQDFVLL